MNFFMILFLKTIQYIENFKLWGFSHKIKKMVKNLIKARTNSKKKKKSKSFEYAPIPALDDKEILREMIIFDH